MNNNFSFIKLTQYGTDSGKKVLMNVNDIVFVKDTGKEREVYFKLADRNEIIYVIESIDEIFSMMGAAKLLVS